MHKKPKILVVDDDKEMENLLEAFLSGQEASECRIIKFMSLNSVHRILISGVL